jgi:hypothetical protein
MIGIADSNCSPQITSIGHEFEEKPLIIGGFCYSNRIAQIGSLL